MGRQAGVRGSYVIPWEQTETDHERNAPLDYLVPGVGWRWFGSPVRLDGAPEQLRLGGAPGPEGLRERAARMAGRLTGGTLSHGSSMMGADDSVLMRAGGFLLTDGLQAFPATLVAGGRLVLFSDMLPTPEKQHWVAQIAARHRRPGRAERATGLMPGTRIETPWGPRAVETLRPGNRVMTADDGIRRIVWIADSHYPAARLAASPGLRPVRIATGALGNGLPERPLLVSPDHRLLLRGRRAQALFGTDEVLVRAADLEDGHGVVRVLAPRGVRYVQLMLARHQLLWANGAPCESFHPELADVTALDPAQRAMLIIACANHTGGMEGFGDTVRRCLSAGEAAILLGPTRPSGAWAA